MKAVVLRSPESLHYTDIPIPRMTDDEHVLIRVEACGICGSDLRYWAGENPWALHTLGHHVDIPPNIVLGHEFAGVVAEVRSPKYEPLVGKRVGVQAYRVCGRCRFCQSGRHNLCKDTIHIGHGQGWPEMEYYPGAYAEYCLGWGDLLYPLPDEISFPEAAMGDVLCVAVHVAGRARVEGQDALCIGGGPVGLSVALVAKAKGARQVFVAETSPLAREVLAKYDLVVIDPSREALAERVPPVPVIFDSVGSNETFNESLPLLEESGTYVNLAVHSTPLSVNGRLMASERTLTTSSNAFYRDVQEAYELIFSRRVDVRPMLTHCFPLTEVQQAFRLLLSSPKQAYKAVLLP